MSRRRSQHRGTSVSAAPLRALPEDELMSTWDPDAGTDPVLSVCCTAYNQARYVRDAIEGFLAQRTRFPFEVLLHDDASTDGTADIIREYAASHPTVVRAVVRETNLYSRNGMTLGNILPFARGRWIAVCEGDDYWISPGKLQLQVDRMERDGTALSAHPALAITPAGFGRIVGSYGRAPRVLPLETVVRRVQPMASTVYSRTALRAFEAFRDDTRPKVGDVYMQAIAATVAGCSYVEDVASVYRQRAEGSWSAAGSTLRSAHDSADIVRCMMLLRARYPQDEETLRAAASRRLTTAVFDLVVAHLDGHRVRVELTSTLRAYPEIVSLRARVLVALVALPRGIGIHPLRLYRRLRDARGRRRRVRHG